MLGVRQHGATHWYASRECQQVEAVRRREVRERQAREREESSGAQTRHEEEVWEANNLWQLTDQEEIFARNVGEYDKSKAAMESELAYCRTDPGNFGASWVQACEAAAQLSGELAMNASEGAAGRTKAEIEYLCTVAEIHVHNAALRARCQRDRELTVP